MCLFLNHVLGIPQVGEGREGALFSRKHESLRGGSHARLSMIATFHSLCWVPHQSFAHLSLIRCHLGTTKNYRDELLLR